MPVLIKAHQSSLADKKTGKKLFYPMATSRGLVGTDELARFIADKSSLTSGDIRNVLENLGEAVNHFFGLGFSVKIEKLGTMRVTVNAQGNGVETAEEVSSDQVNSAHVVFREEKHRSGKVTRTTLSSTIEYEMVRGVVTDDEDTGDDPTGDGGDTTGGDTTGGDTGDGGDLLG